jgi:type I restriction enzyme, S subunit
MNQDRTSTTTNSQLKDGYKQTEVGVIPENWEIKRLKHISPSQSVGLVINPSSYFDSAGSVPMLVGSHINENGIDWESANRISDFSNNLLPSSRLAAGDLVTVRVGDPGLTAVVPSELDGCNCASMMIVRQHRSFVSRWLCYVMNSPFGRSQIEHVQYGTAQKQFNISDAIDFSYPVPPLPEQEAIAHTLSDIDALIESLDRLLTKKRQIKQGAMQELLRSKDGWVEKKMSEIAEIRSGGTPSTSRHEFWDGDILWCTPTDITALKGYKYLVNTLRLITLQGLNSSSAEMIPMNSVVMTSRATIGECAINRVPISTNQGFKNFIPFDGIDVEFLYYSLQTQKQKFISLCGGSTFLEIGKNQLSEFLIELPLLPEQIEIANILSDMDAEIGSIESKLTKTRQLKQGMMHELLTGRIRLVDRKNI